MKNLDAKKNHVKEKEKDHVETAAPGCLPREARLAAPRLHRVVQKEAPLPTSGVS
jgi:hypothetical protein